MSFPMTRTSIKSHVISKVVDKMEKQLDKLRIMFFEHGEFGGSVRSVGQLIKGLSALGCKVGLVSQFRKTGPENIGYMKEVLFWRCLDLSPKVSPRPEIAARTFKIPHPTRFGMQYFFTALRALRSFRPDIAYFNCGIETSIPAAIAARMLGIPTICHLRIAKDLYTIEKTFINLFDHFVVLTKAGQNIAQDNGISPQKLTQLYNPFDNIETFNIQAKETLSLNMFWDKNCKYIIQIGTLNNRKRPLLALDAFAIARANCPNLHLIFVGSGTLREELEQAIRKRGLADYVHLIGECLQIPALLSHCHIGLFVSAKEGLGRAIIEYMYAGLPVVTWDMPVYRELIRDGQTGFLVKEDTAECFAQAIIRLYNSEELRKRIGKAGQEWVMQGQFDISNYMQNIYKLLNNIANKNARKQFVKVDI